MIFIALLVMWLVGLFPHMVRRRTQLADSARVDRLPDSVRVIGPTPQESTGSSRSTEAILPTAAARTAAIEQHLDVKTMESPEATTSTMRSAAARPARPVRRSERPPSAQPGARPAADVQTPTSHGVPKRRLRIRRLGIGFLGLAGITLLSVVLALFSVMTWVVPVVACALTVVDFLMLRSAHAAADVKSTAAQRTDGAGEPAGPAARRDTRATGAKTSSSLAMAASAFEAEPTPEPDTADHDAADHDAHDVTEDSALQPDRPRTSSVSWSPVPVPRPTYLDAPKAERAEPAPLVADASVHDPVSEPVADHDRSTETEELSQESAAQRWVEEPGQRPEVEDARPVTKNKTAAEVGRLDDVLQRRRAVGE